MAKSQLNKDYFVGLITVAQVTDTSVQNDLAWFIARYEEEMIVLLLGQPLYDAYVAGMAEVAPLAKWTALDQKLYKTTTPKMSPAANYVYWFYMKNQATQTTGNGEVLIKGQNSIPVGSAVKVKTAWNDMIRQNKDLVAWIKSKPEDYPEYVEPVFDYSTPESTQLYKDRMNIIRTAIPFF